MNSWTILLNFALSFGATLLPWIIILLLFFLLKNCIYKKSTYYQITKTPYLFLMCDKGKYGEYLVYKNLQYFETKGAKFLFNVYIPKANTETTEIDVLMIYEYGIFVFESKNYGGWIFGDESKKHWHQTLPKGRGKAHKESFYNPIMQNRAHIKHLEVLCNKQIPMHSIIVFSNQCTLKNIKTRSEGVQIIQQDKLYATVSSICKHADSVLNQADVQDIYNQLYPYTQVDKKVKEKHIANINNHITSNNKDGFNKSNKQQ